MALNDRQERFLELYLTRQPPNAAQAYIDAGYKAKTPKHAGDSASRLLADPRMKVRLTEFKTEVRNRTVLNAEALIDHLETIRSRCMQGEEILGPFGVPTGIWKFDSKGALGAIKMIGEYMGIWGDDKRPMGDFRPKAVTPYSPQETLARLIQLRTIEGTRRIKDAIQIESPTKVPLQPAPSDSETMGAGDSELPGFAGLQDPECT